MKSYLIDGTHIIRIQNYEFSLNFRVSEDDLDLPYYERKDSNPFSHGSVMKTEELRTRMFYFDLLTY